MGSDGLVVGSDWATSRHTPTRSPPQRKPRSRQARAPGPKMPSALSFCSRSTGAIALMRASLYVGPVGAQARSPWGRPTGVRPLFGVASLGRCAQHGEPGSRLPLRRRTRRWSVAAELAAIGGPREAVETINVVSPPSGAENCRPFCGPGFGVSRAQGRPALSRRSRGQILISVAARSAPSGVDAGAETFRPPPTKNRHRGETWKRVVVDAAFAHLLDLFAAAQQARRGAAPLHVGLRPTGSSRNIV